MLLLDNCSPVQWIGGVSTFVALALLARHLLRLGPQAVLARLGMAASVTVAAIFTALQAVDGVSLKMAVDAWAHAAPARREALFSAAEAIRWTEIGLNAIGRMVQGVAIASVAVAAAAVGFHGRTLGLLGVVGGIGGVAGGVATAYTGFSTTAAVIAMPAMLLSIIWLVGAAVVMLRRAAMTSVCAEGV